MRNFIHALFVILVLGTQVNAQKSAIPSAAFSEKDRNLITSVLEVRNSSVSYNDKVRSTHFKSMSVDTDSTYYDVETPASFPGGQQRLNEFIKQNLVIPQDAKGKTIVVRFKVERYGEVNRIHIIDYCSNVYMGAEAIKVVRKMGPWNPAKIQGIEVASFYELPIRF